MNKIRKGDQVIVTTGRDKGKRGTVTQRVDEERLVVEACAQPKYLVHVAVLYGVGAKPKGLNGGISVVRLLVVGLAAKGRKQHGGCFFGSVLGQQRMSQVHLASGMPWRSLEQFAVG